MLRYIYLIVSIATIVLKASNGNAQSPLEIQGEATNGLRSSFLVQKYGTDWNIEIDLLAQTNFSEGTWLKITNRVGSKLQLWLTNGMEMQSTNQNVLAAMKLPTQTTVADVMRGVRGSRHGLQWWRTRINGTVAGELGPLATFSLQNAFDISFTNDVVLQITPLLYKVETNEVTAHLVEFPPIKMKLLSTGDVQEIKLNSTRQP